ncbi:MAG: cation:proton antiporter [Chlamydiota bacterium]
MNLIEQVSSSFYLLPSTLIIGIIIIAGFFFGRSVHRLKFPAILGYMLAGVVLGPSFLNIANNDIQQHLDFFVQITLALVALNIGLELKIKELWGSGRSILCIILSESFMAFLLTGTMVFLLTHNIPLAVLLGCVAPASAPAGTVAVIQEYKSHGKLTKALYAVVGFDDGLAIIIFGFALAFVKFWFAYQGDSFASYSILPLFLQPLQEIGLSFLLGVMFAVGFYLLAKKIADPRETLVLLLGFILITASISKAAGASIILSNMVMGLILGNIPTRDFRSNIEIPLMDIMPFMYIMFFVLAGAHLDISRLGSISLLGLVYVLGRTSGLLGGAWLGAAVTKAEPSIRKYLGFGILSQAGVAIGLSLIIKNELHNLGDLVELPQGGTIYAGDLIGGIVITTITVTSIVFGVIGPLLTKVALKKAGEIPEINHARLRDFHKVIALKKAKPHLWTVYKRSGSHSDNAVEHVHKRH